MKIETIGQKTAVGLLESYGNKVIETGKAGKPRLIIGKAGIGKSHISGAFISAFTADFPCNVVRVKSASEFARSDAPASLELIQALKDSTADLFTIIEIDEGHSLPIAPMSASPSPMQRVFNSLLYGSGEGWARRGHIEFLGEEISFNAANLLILILTNHPEKIGKGNSDAIRRRMQEVPLSLYTSAEMRKVIPAFFAKKGRAIEKSAIPVALNLHRGTLEAMDNLLELLPASGDITREMIESALPYCKFKLRGFTAEEIRVLHWLSTTTEPRKAQNIRMRFPQLDLGEFFRHAIAQHTVIKGELTHTPFLIMDSKQQYAPAEIFVAWFNKNREALSHCFES